MRLKGCPRCSGDVIVESDAYGWFEHCLQCGYQRDLPGATRSLPKPQEKNK